MKHMELENIGKIKKVLLSVSFIKTVEDFYGLEIDYVANVTTVNGDKYKLNFEFMQEAYPSLVKDRLMRIKQQNTDEYFVIAAPYISKSTMDLCRIEGVGFIDYAGNCFIEFKNLYIFIAGNKNPNTKKRAMKSIFERSSVVSSRILRLLLKDINRRWKLQEISEHLSCSIGQVYKVKAFLQKNMWIEFGSDGIVITDALAIMNEWARVFNEKENRTYECYSLDSMAVIEEKFKTLMKEGYYLSGFSGGVRYSSSVRYNKGHVYVSGDRIDDVMNKLNLKKVESGANVSIIVPYDECVLYDSRTINGFNVVSPVQVYLDCAYLKGRGEELAESILLKEINR